MKIRFGLSLVALSVSALVAAACTTPPPTTTTTTTVPEAAMLAVAYSNLDGVDGYDPSGSDVLIAKLVDTDLDGAVSVGDTIETDRFPRNLSASNFAPFLVTTRTLYSVGSVSAGLIEVFDSPAGGFSSLQRFVWESRSSVERYSEERGPNFSLWLDRLTGEDSIDRYVIDPESPSRPDSILTDAITVRLSDDQFIDVDIFI